MLEPDGALVIRLVLRALAYFLLAAAFAVGVVDTTRSVERETLVLTPFERTAALLPAPQPDVLEAALKPYVPGLLWDFVFLAPLRLPAVLVLAAIAVMLFRLSRPRKRRFETI